MRRISAPFAIDGSSRQAQTWWHCDSARKHVRRQSHPFIPAQAPSRLVCNSSKQAAEPVSPLVQQILQTPGLEAPEGSSPEQMLKVTEAFWRAMKDPLAAAKPSAAVITQAPTPLLDGQVPEYDVCVAGGTLGIFLALALRQKGHRVCVVERRRLKGRSQEWNISTSDLDALVTAGLLTHDEMMACVETSWDDSRIGFHGGGELWISGVLNCGISPRRLISTLKHRFLEAGGVIFEGTAFKSAVVHTNGTLVRLQPGSGGQPITPADVNRPTAVSGTDCLSGDALTAVSPNEGERTPSACVPTEHQISVKRELTCRLLIDCMGHYSPIVKQIRHGQAPDGMVVVVGGCFQNSPSASNPLIFPHSADLLYSFTDSFHDSQFFWEAFPAEGGTSRTAYMFSYIDAHPDRPSFSSLLDTFFTLLPSYQGVELSDIVFKRILFGGFPCYIHNSPLPPAFDRVLQIGDAAAGQSPLSFGGFGAMIRHLPRLSRGVDHALKENRLSRGDIGWLQPYQPSLSAAWLFQRSMSVKVGQLRESQDPTAAAAAAPRSELSFENDNNKTKEKAKRGSGWLSPDHINRLLRCNFAVMRAFGDRVMRPFVQDALEAGPLALTMLGMILRDPIAVTTVLFQTGPLLILGWFRHFFALLGATLLYTVLRPLRTWVQNYTFQRFVDALEYGAAADYHYRPGKMVVVDKGAVEEPQKEVVNDNGSEEHVSSEGGNQEVEGMPWPAMAT